VVAAGSDALARRVGRYLFVSSLSVYARPDRPGLDENAPLAVLDDPATEDVLPNYGALKAACEAAVTARFGLRTTIVRPGLIVGPYDATDRFGYWVARFRHPELLGDDRGPDAVAPGPPERPIQVIDARDLAAWMLDLLETDRGGTFNACSNRGHWTMRDLVDALRSAVPPGPQSAWTDDATLLAQGVEPWVGLPLWIPASDPESAAFMEFDCTRAADAGLVPRPLTSTIDDTAAWLAARDNAGAWKHVLSAERERAVVAAQARG
jgi:2'-hydroxyisoflavone reductase